jgi:hypothetical protein
MSSTYASEDGIKLLLQLLRSAFLADGNHRGRIMVVLSVGAKDIEATVPSLEATRDIAAILDDDQWRPIGDAAMKVMRRGLS